MKTIQKIGLATLMTLFISLGIMGMFPVVMGSSVPVKFTGGASITDPADDVIKFNSTSNFTQGDYRDDLDVTLIEVSGQNINLTFAANIHINATIYILIDTDNDDTENFTIAYSHIIGDRAVLINGNYTSTIYWNTSIWDPFINNATTIGTNNTKFLNVTIPSTAYSLTGSEEFAVYVVDMLTEKGSWTYIDYVVDISLSDFFPPIPGFEFLLIILAIGGLMTLYFLKKPKINIQS